VRAQVRQRQRRATVVLAFGVTLAAGACRDGHGGDDVGQDVSGGMLLHPFDAGLPDYCEPAGMDCPGGHKCSPYAPDGGCCVGATQCVPLQGNFAEGQACTRTADNDDCGIGLFCMTASSGGAGEGVCLRMCRLDESDCPQGTCRPFDDGFLPVCVVECDPLAQNCADPGTACYALWYEGAFVCAPSGDPSADGDACGTFQACAPGLVCAPGERLADCAADCCTPVCDPDGDGSECVEPGEGCEVVFAGGAACVLPE
jgi:hypothetical protein